MTFLLFSFTNFLYLGMDFKLIMLSTAFFCVWCLNKNYWIITGVQPTDEEKEVWEKVQAVLNESQTILQDIQQYTGATEDIKQVSNTNRSLKSSTS